MRRAQAESGTTLTPSDLTPSRLAPPRVLPPSLTAAGTSTAASSSSSDASSRVRGGPRRASSAPLHAPPPRLPLPANAAVSANAQSCRRTSSRGLPCRYEQLVGHRTARDVSIFRRLTRFMVFAGFRLAAQTAGNGSGEITSPVPHIRIPLLVHRQRGDCETVARPAPQQRPGKDGAVVSPPRSPHLISGGDALPVPSPAPPRAAERAYTLTTNTALDARTCPLTPAEPAAPTAPPLLRQPLRAQPSTLLTSGPRPAPSSCQRRYDPVTPWSVQPASGRPTHATSSEAPGGQPPDSASTDQQARVSCDVARTRDGRPYENERLPLDDLRAAVV